MADRTTAMTILERRKKMHHKEGSCTSIDGGHQPPRLARSEDADSLGSAVPTRGRTSSRDYVHDYDKSYANQDDMVGMVIDRRGFRKDQLWGLFTCYVIAVTVMGMAVMMVVPFSKWGFTVTNILHFLVTLYCLHWSKGGWSDDQGELLHMTVWEQLAATKGARNLRVSFRLVPIVLCYLACVEVGWGAAPLECALNCVVCILSELGKTSMMDGIRIAGINGDPLLLSEEKDKKEE